MTQVAKTAPLAVTVPVGCRISGLGRTTLYRLISEGRLAAVTIGRRRLINYASLRALVDSSAA